MTKEAPSRPDLIEALAQSYQIPEALKAIEQISDPVEKFSQLLFLAGVVFEGPDEENPDPNGDPKRVEEILDMAAVVLQVIPDPEFDYAEGLMRSRFQLGDREKGKRYLERITDGVEKMSDAREKISKLRLLAGAYDTFGYKDESRAMIDKARKVCQEEIHDDKERAELM
jgi:hypothetical protein